MTGFDCPHMFVAEIENSSGETRGEKFFERLVMAYSPIFREVSYPVTTEILLVLVPRSLSTLSGTSSALNSLPLVGFWIAPVNRNVMKALLNVWLSGR